MAGETSDTAMDDVHVEAINQAALVTNLARELLLEMCHSDIPREHPVDDAFAMARDHYAAADMEVDAQEKIMRGATEAPEDSNEYDAERDF